MLELCLNCETMPERRTVVGPDREPSVIYSKHNTPSNAEVAAATHQLNGLRAPEKYKPYISGMSTVQTHPGFPRVGIPPEVSRTLYINTQELQQGTLPMGADADISGLKISDAGVAPGLSGQERRIILSGPSTAVDAYSMHYRVPQKPANISEFPALPRNVRRLHVVA